MAKLGRNVPILDSWVALTNVIQQHRDYSNENLGISCVQNDDGQRANEGRGVETL